MSRKHDALVEGSADVRLVCDVCGLTRWIGAVPITFDDPCIEYLAVERSKAWRFADEALVCSDACEKAFWEWE